MKHSHHTLYPKPPITLDEFLAYLERNPGFKILASELWHSQTGTKLRVALEARRSRVNTQEEAH